MSAVFVESAIQGGAAKGGAESPASLYLCRSFPAMLNRQNKGAEPGAQIDKLLQVVSVLE